MYNTDNKICRNTCKSSHTTNKVCDNNNKLIRKISQNNNKKNKSYRFSYVARLVRCWRRREGGEPWSRTRDSSSEVLVARLGDPDLRSLHFPVEKNILLPGYCSHCCCRCWCCCCCHCCSPLRCCCPTLSWKLLQAIHCCLCCCCSC